MSKACATTSDSFDLASCICLARKGTHAQCSGIQKASKAPSHCGCQDRAQLQIALRDSEKPANQAHKLGADLDALPCIQQLASAQYIKSAIKGLVVTFLSWNLQFTSAWGLFLSSCFLACPRKVHRFVRNGLWLPTLQTVGVCRGYLPGIK